MAKYYIVTRKYEEAIEAASKEDAMINFATGMDLDMNQYFMAVSEAELREMREQEQAEARKKFVTDFMEDELISNFDLAENAACDVAQDAYNILCEGDGKTEYECIEAAYEKFKKEMK